MVFCITTLIVLTHLGTVCCQSSLAKSRTCMQPYNSKVTRMHAIFLGRKDTVGDTRLGTLASVASPLTYAGWDCSGGACPLQ